jgi:hypothetical protein
MDVNDSCLFGLQTDTRLMAGAMKVKWSPVVGFSIAIAWTLALLVCSILYAMAY